MNAIEHEQYLKAKLELVESIYSNTTAQCQALQSNNGELLGKLLKKQQQNINSLIEFGNLYSLPGSYNKDSDSEGVESYIGSLMETIICTSIANISDAEKLRNEIGSSLCLLKKNKNVIKNGYYVKSYQHYGYFIDKKIGK